MGWEIPRTLEYLKLDMDYNSPIVGLALPSGLKTFKMRSDLMQYPLCHIPFGVQRLSIPIHTAIHIQTRIPESVTVISAYTDISKHWENMAWPAGLRKLKLFMPDATGLTLDKFRNKYPDASIVVYDFDEMCGDFFPCLWHEQ